jgi:oxygen-dependent protoporphyrinogen oxidase
VEVIDAASRAGGVIGSEVSGGALYERGPNSVLDTNPHIGELVRDLGLAHERLDASAIAAKRYVVRGGRLAALPATPAAFLTSPVFSLRAKLRLLREPFVARTAGTREESVSDFVQRRLGRDFLDYAVEPFVAGIYAGDPDELSLRAAFPRLHALEQRYGSLIKGQVLGARERARQAERGKNTAGSFTFRHGMQTLPDALARALGGVRTGVSATTLRRGDDGHLILAVESAAGAFEASARSVVLAVPAHAAAALVRDCAADAAQALEEIPYAAIASVALSYARADVAHPLDGFGFLAPRVEKRRILGSLFSSSMFEGRAPAGAVLLTSFVGGRRNPELAAQSDDEIARAVREELAELIGATGTPRLSVVTRWREAIPQYTLGHLERVARAAAAERALPGLYLCSSYRGGVSVGDCIKSACETADRVEKSVHAGKKV